ncbi:MAG: acetylornithine deacetylase [Gammaproteobacteria bacterium]|nr:acetylornithine deacetylase [Gammaproteobacteria bacterium]MBU1653756.1 acetylornithine deacetylase [Gammaproteobacteria bacterium]MBU1962539.1 acetylornithine deacetylase [Gammaproteobacteria bacterium]
MRPPPLFAMLEGLIAAPSVSSVNPRWDQGNRGVIEQLDTWLSDLSFRTLIQAIPNYPNKFNLIASLGGGPEGLVLAGHSDTVPFDENRWRSDPFCLTERDSRLHGLGTADMKGFFALVIEALRELPLDKLQRPLTIIATADEESSMCGAQALAGLGTRLGRHVVIGEPTGLRPIRSHKGIAMEAIRLSGRSGHSSDPSLGNSALEGMHRVIGELLQWRGELQRRYRNPLFAVEVPTLNLGHIHGGDNPNRICGHCELHIDLRPLPGISLDELRGELEGRLRALIEPTGLELEIERLFSGVPAMETPAEAAIVRATEELTGQIAGAVAFATEGPYFNDMGMETVILGPGSIDQAHQPNEYLGLDQIEPGIRLIRELVWRFCLAH